MKELYQLLSILTICITLISVIIIFFRSKSNSIKIKKGDSELQINKGSADNESNCRDNDLCDEYKFGTIFFKAMDITEKLKDIPNKRLKDQMEYFEDKTKVIEQKIIEMYKKLEAKLFPSTDVEKSKKNLMFFVSIVRLFLQSDMKNLAREDFKNVDILKSSEKDFNIFKKTRVEAILELIKRSAPVSSMIPDNMYDLFFSEIKTEYYLNIAPINEDIIQHSRDEYFRYDKIEKDVKNELNKFFKMYTGQDNFYDNLN